MRRSRSARSSRRPTRPRRPPSAQRGHAAPLGRRAQGREPLNDATALLLFSAAISFPSHGGVDGWRRWNSASRPRRHSARHRARRAVCALSCRSSPARSAATCSSSWARSACRSSPSGCACRRFLSGRVRDDDGAYRQRHNPAPGAHPQLRGWGTAVFLLNVLAFLLMGLQARSIIGAMTPDRLREAAWFAAVVVATLIVVRMAGWSPSTALPLASAGCAPRTSRHRCATECSSAGAGCAGA